MPASVWAIASEIRVRAGGDPAASQQFCHPWWMPRASGAKVWDLTSRDHLGPRLASGLRRTSSGDDKLADREFIPALHAKNRHPDASQDPVSQAQF